MCDEAAWRMAKAEPQRRKGRKGFSEFFESERAIRKKRRPAGLLIAGFNLSLLHFERFFWLHSRLPINPV
jgi:hypothetical protein